MRRYETTFILNPQADDAVIDQQVTAVINLIKEDSGQIVHDDRMGTRRLAYPIEGLVQGYYASIIFDAETTVLTKLDRLYKLEEPYIRYLTIRYEGPIGSEKEEVAPKTVPEAAEKTVPETEKASDVPATVETEKTEEPDQKVEAVEEPATATEEKASEPSEPASDQPVEGEEEL